jgi:glycosyltransferase involved in cell wall biosynthesis
MAAGRPVVATEVGGVPDVVRRDETGLLVPPAAPDALGAAMVRLATSETARARLGTAGRRHASRFVGHRLVGDVNRLYIAGLEAKRKLQRPLPQAQR